MSETAKAEIEAVPAAAPAAAFDFIEVQKKWQNVWYSNKVFEPIVDKKRPKFFLTVPYPYVSGPLHLGHGRTYTVGDIIARYKRSCGYNLLWPLAFHITGTPVAAISARIKRGEAEHISMYKEYVALYEHDPAKIEEIVASFVEPTNVVKFFSSQQVKDFCSLGFSLDLSRQFTTGDDEYKAFIQWQFRKYKEKGYIIQGSYPVLYCRDCKNAVGEDDIQGGDENPVEVMSYTAFKFELSPNEYIISCTLRPETVFGITNLFVNPQATYVKARVDGEHWWMSDKAVEKLLLQGKQLDLLETQKGEGFIGRFVKEPLGRSVPILPAAFVDPRNASGWVHSVPAHAPYDLIALRDLASDEETLNRYNLSEIVKAIKPIPVIKLPGFSDIPAIDACEKFGARTLSDIESLEKATSYLYREEYYHGCMLPTLVGYGGLSVAEAKEKVATQLQQEGKATIFYETNRVANCRCGGEVVAAVLPDQWFLDYGVASWKKRAHEALERLVVIPLHYKKMFEDVFGWLDKRPCARRRGLGTQLPFANEWMIESLSDSTIYMAFYTIIKGIRRHGIKAEQLCDAFFDWVLLGSGTRAKASAASGVAEATLEELRDEFVYWYPVDLRHTAVAHIGNHLSFFIFAHSALFDPRLWPRAISLNEMVISEGAKMSKSRGNVVLLKSVAETIGADAFRLYVASVGSDSILDYRAREVLAMKRNLGRFVALVSELLRAKAFIKEQGPILVPKAAAYNWARSRIERAVADATELLDSFQLRPFVQLVFFDLLNDIDWALRRAIDDGERAVIGEGILSQWLTLLMPIIPHTCEELWSRAGYEGLVSLARWPKAQEEWINAVVEARERYLQRLLEDVKEVRGLLKAPAKTLKLIVASEAKRQTLKKALEGVEDIEGLQGVAELRDKPALRAYVMKGFWLLKGEGVLDFDEFDALVEAREFLSRETGLVVEVEREETSVEQKASRALPLKPAIVLL